MILINRIRALQTRHDKHLPWYGYSLSSTSRGDIPLTPENATILNVLVETSRLIAYLSF